MQQSELNQIVKDCLKQCKLRPQEVLISEISQYQDNPNLDPTKKGLQFFSIDFYWDENYFDELQCSTKIKQLQERLNEKLKTLDNYVSNEWGASDGHLFNYVTIK